MSSKINNLKIFIINLKKDKEKINFQKKQFKKENLKFERVDNLW